MSNEELVRLYQEGNKEALEELIEQNRGIIAKLSNKYMNINKTLEFDDLFNSGVIGFIYAVKRYDFNNDKKAKFITYAVHYINRYICSCVNGWSNKDIANTKFYNSCISINTPVGNNSDSEDIDIIDTIESHDNSFENVEDKLYLKQLRSDLEKAMIETNTLREREVLKLHYGWNCKPCNYTEIAEIFNISRSRPRQAVVEALRKLRWSKEGRKLKEKYKDDIVSYHDYSYTAIERKIDDEISEFYNRLVI